MVIQKTVKKTDVANSLLSKQQDSKYLPLHIPKLDPIAVQLENIRQTLISLDTGLIRLEEGYDTIEINEESSQVDGFRETNRFRRVSECVIETIRVCKLTNLKYEINEPDRVIWIVVDSANNIVAENLYDYE